MDSAKSVRSGPNRPLRLLHLMGFVGAVAISCYVIPALVGASLRAVDLPPLPRRIHVIHLASFTLILWAFILTSFTLFVNRRSLRRVGRSYGAAAIFSAAISIAILTFRQIIVRAVNTAIEGRTLALDPISETLAGDFWKILDEAPGAMAAAILAVWSILAIIRAGRRPAGGLERFNFFFATVCLLWGLFGALMYHVPWSWLDQRIS